MLVIAFEPVTYARTMLLREWMSSRNGGVATVTIVLVVLTYVNVAIHQQYREHVVGQVSEVIQVLFVW